MDRTKEYSFVLSTMPRLHARSRLLELDVWGIIGGREETDAASGSEHAHSEYRAKVKPGEIRTTQMMLASQARFPNTGLKIRAKFWIFQKM